MTSSLVDLIEHSICFLYKSSQSLQSIDMKVYNRNTLCDENEDEQIIIAPACKFLPLGGGIKIWACHLRCQILYKAPTQSNSDSPYLPLYFRPKTSKHFVQTHVNPLRVPCFFSVCQVWGLITCGWRCPPSPSNPILRRDKCVGENCTWIYSSPPGTGTEWRFSFLSHYCQQVLLVKISSSSPHNTIKNGVQ